MRGEIEWLGRPLLSNRKASRRGEGWTNDIMYEITNLLIPEDPMKLHSSLRLAIVPFQAWECSGWSLQEGGQVDVLFLLFSYWTLSGFSHSVERWWRGILRFGGRDRSGNGGGFRQRRYMYGGTLVDWTILDSKSTNCLIADRSPLDCFALVQIPAEWRRNYALDTTETRHTYAIPSGEGFFDSPFYVNTASPTDLAADADQHPMYGCWFFR